MAQDEMQQTERAIADAVMRPWEDMTEAEQAGVIQRTAARTLDLPLLREWTAERLRRETPEDSFMHLVADAMDAELAAREARKRLRVLAGVRLRLPSPGARPHAPGLTVIDGYAPSPFAGPQGRPGGNPCRKPGSR